MIHEQGIRLSKQEKDGLSNRAKTQEGYILSILKDNPQKQFAFFELVEITRFNRDSVKRSLSNLSGSDDSRKDESGAFPLQKHPDIKKKNPNSGIRVSTYQWNTEYGIRSSIQEGALFPKDNQPNLFG